jgi:hypothetical protein
MPVIDRRGHSQACNTAQSFNMNEQRKFYRYTVTERTAMSHIIVWNVSRPLLWPLALLRSHSAE